MTATKNALVAFRNDRLLFTGESLTLDSARQLVGGVVEMPTNNANETAPHKIESVSQNHETGDIVAWVVRDGHGHHARIVAKRA